MPTKTLAPNQLTLGGFTAADDNAAASLPTVDQDGDKRRVLTFTGTYQYDNGMGRMASASRPALTRDWQRATLDDGRVVEVRLASCGLPRCFCAGEFRFVA